VAKPLDEGLSLSLHKTAETRRKETGISPLGDAILQSCGKPEKTFI
jgi:hypothetical protein